MTKLKTVLLISAAAFATAASAQGTNPIKLTQALMQVDMVKDANGKTVEKLTDAGKGVFPGRTYDFTLKTENTSKANVNNVSLNLPIPAHFVFQSQNCDANVNTLYSVDGKTFANPLKKTVTVNGVSKEVTVEPREYRYVRWTLPTIKAGQVINCAARTTVN